MNFTLEKKSILKGAYLLLLVIALFLSNGRHTIFFAAWISSSMLLHLTRQFSTVKAWLLAWGFLTVAMTYQYYTMVPLPFLYLSLIMCGAALMISIPYVLDNLFLKYKKRFIHTLIFPASWAFIEYFYQYLPYGTWGHTAYSQHSQMELLQSISLFGMGYITFLIGLFASFCNWIYDNRNDLKTSRSGIAIFTIIFLSTLLYGGLRLNFNGPNSKTVRIASISAGENVRMGGALLNRYLQKNISSSDFARKSEVVNDHLFTKSKLEVEAGSEIIFWAEANTYILKDKENEFYERASKWAVKNNVILGVTPLIIDSKGDKLFENKFIVFNSEGDKIIDYWKALPVPGAEASNSLIVDPKIQEVETDYGIISGVICFDMDFPYHLQQASQTDIMLVPSNDWRSIDPWHTEMSKYRAIEQGFNMVRQTSNGLSAGYDYLGNTLSEMDHFYSENKVLVTFQPRNGKNTLYSKIGDTFTILCLIIFVSSILYLRKRWNN